MDFAKAKNIFADIYSEIDGYKIAQDAHKKLSYFYEGNIYGEVEFGDFYKILSEVTPKNGEVFYDLGSGTGKPSFVAYLCFNFSKVIGVEKVKELHASSKKTLERLRNRYPTELLYFKPNVHMDFINSDFKIVNFSDADVVFMNSYTYFNYEIFNAFFISKLQHLKRGTRIITTVIPINLPFMRFERKGPFKFSWGKEFVFINTKVD